MLTNGVPDDQLFTLRGIYSNTENARGARADPARGFRSW